MAPAKQEIRVSLEKYGINSPNKTAKEKPEEVTPQELRNFLSGKTTGTSEARVVVEKEQKPSAAGASGVGSGESERRETGQQSARPITPAPPAGQSPKEIQIGETIIKNWPDGVSLPKGARVIQPKEPTAQTGVVRHEPVAEQKPATVPTNRVGGAAGAGESRRLEVGQQPVRRPEAGATSANPSPKISEGPPRKEIHGIQIEIGNKTYVLSDEAQKYLGGIRVSDYKKSRSVLVINEPHESREGHFNLYKFLEVFFRDNPTLVSETVFLAEGFPANQPISLKPLIEAEPNPSEELITEVLNTFLITGYMAYEWRHHQGIPIVGTEDTLLYRSASRLVLGQTEEEIFLANFAIVARNRSMANTLARTTERYKNPILFIGADHLTDHMVNTDLQKFKRSNLGASLPTEEAERLRNFENLSIGDYLRKERIGYTFLVPSIFSGMKLGRDHNLYMRLFRAQQTGDYRGYIEELISERTGGVTTRPSPEAATDFVKAYKKIPPGNPEARANYQKGMSLMIEGKFIEAAEEFSAASAAEPKIPGYVFSFQDSLFREFTSRIIRVIKDPESAKCTINPSIEPDLPVLGPYIEKDYEQQVAHFTQRFGQIPGAKWLIEKLNSRFWVARYGGSLLVKTAERIGPELIRGFAEVRQVHGLRTVIKSRVDLGTKDNTAVICKNFPQSNVSVSEIYSWVEQSIHYLEPDIKGYKYRNVLIVIPDNANLSEFEQAASEYLKLNYPDYLGKIRIQRVSQINEGQQKAVPKSGVVFDAREGLKDKKPFVGIGDPQSDAKFYKKQHGGTCAVVAQEEIIHKLKGFDPGEETLKQKAIERGWYEEGEGTYDVDLGKLLELNGIPVEQRWYATLDDLKREIDKGNKVIVGVNATLLWYNKLYNNKGHAVWVTGLRTDKEGKIVSVAMNDSGNEKIDGGGEVPVDRFIRAWEKTKCVMVSTRLPKK